MLQLRIISILKKSPVDQYSIYREIAGATMSEITKAIAELQQADVIHVASYRKSKRTGLDVPVYSLTAPRQNKLDLHTLLAGVTSERLVEYDFLTRNLVPVGKNATMLDIGSAGSKLAKVIRDFGKTWRVFGIDLEPGCDARMDAQSMGFADAKFDQVISISTIEHIDDDTKAMQEISRILKKGGSAVITIPYGKGKKSEHKIYNKHTLYKLVAGLSIVAKEFYRYESGKWIKCSQAIADQVDVPVPIHLHSAVCACLLLRKTR
ncbi:MAG TPA: class I SAM-dependent methyltransferase [Nitrososphaera sp.]|nr:class I SAM-dependent methyltransferase [Nitrososphaera sp.]